MTRTQRTIGLHWRGLATLCAIVALAGIAVILWQRIDATDRNYAAAKTEADAAKTEADRRGDAVSTLATDVRRLRAQVQAAGKKPAAPDPSKAVPGLSDRTEVPVPIPGAQGVQGVAGKNGTNGQDSKVPGPQGQQGIQGEPGQQGVQGVPGKDGTNGQNGKDGVDGKDGQACPTGYSWQTPDYDPNAQVCRKDGAPQPTPSNNSSLLGLAIDRRRAWNL